MIRFVSQQSDHDYYLSFDPALVQRPADEEGAKDYDAKLTAARKTSNYAPLIVEGQTPTKFVLGQVDPATFRAVLDRISLGASEPRRIGPYALQRLMFRLAIREIPSLGARIEYKRDPEWDGWKMAPAELADQMDATHPLIVAEIGNYVFYRAQEVDPLV